MSRCMMCDGAGCAACDGTGEAVRAQPPSDGTVKLDPRAALLTKALELLDVMGATPEQIDRWKVALAGAPDLRRFLLFCDHIVANALGMVEEEADGRLRVAGDRVGAPISRDELEAIATNIKAKAEALYGLCEHQRRSPELRRQHRPHLDPGHETWQGIEAAFHAMLRRPR